MNKQRQHQIIALLLGMMIAVIAINVLLVAVYIGLATAQTVQASAEQAPLVPACGLQKTAYSNGYTVYFDTCAGEILAYITP